LIMFIANCSIGKKSYANLPICHSYPLLNRLRINIDKNEELKPISIP